MASSLEPLTLAEVPVRTVPLKLKLMSAMNGVVSSLLYKKDRTVNRTLMNLIAQTEKASATPVDGVSSKDITVDEETKQYVRIYAPSQQESKKLPVIVYFHGGGFAANGPNSTFFCNVSRAVVKAANAVLVCVSYRLAPEFRYPTAYDDCFQALRWLQSDCQSGDLSSAVDPSQCFLMGDSAGANIAHRMMVKATQNNLGPLQIKGVILIMPFFGGTERTPFEFKTPNALIVPLWMMDWFWEAYLPVGSDRSHEACNVFGPNSEDISGLTLPPILVTIGSLDVLQDWQLRYVEKLKEMGKQVQVKFTDFAHGEYVFEEPLKKVAADAAQFIKALTS
ncbi:hypothetical protein Mapa_011861 [Marchantia paleacea]|nr:hypothetical protein Mapa_011861 [Marchantia paleacea]